MPIHWSILPTLSSSSLEHQVLGWGSFVQGGKWRSSFFLLKVDTLYSQHNHDLHSFGIDPMGHWGKWRNNRHTTEKPVSGELFSAAQTQCIYYRAECGGGLLYSAEWGGILCKGAISGCSHSGRKMLLIFANTISISTCNRESFASSLILTWGRVCTLRGLSH